MLIEVIRDTFTDKSTTSIWLVDGRFECYGLEDVDRKVEADPKAKVYGRTAIPRGVYEIEMHPWPKYGKPMPLLKDVPGYQGVFIHPGNTHEDTEGCLLPGEIRGEDIVGRSRDAFAALYKRIVDAFAVGDRVRISIV